jgi:hypothetical protein
MAIFNSCVKLPEGNAEHVNQLVVTNYEDLMQMCQTM